MSCAHADRFVPQRTPREQIQRLRAQQLERAQTRRDEQLARLLAEQQVERERAEAEQAAILAERREQTRRYFHGRNR
jgi:hypothetical protein